MRRGSPIHRFNRFLFKHLVPRFAVRQVLLMARAGRYALRASGILFVVASLAASANAWLHGSGSVALYIRLLLDPARALAAMVVAAWVFPYAFPSPRRALLFSLFLPTVFIGLLITLKVVFEGTGPPLVRFGEAPRADVMWRDPGFLALVWVLQIPLLFLFTRPYK